MKPSDSAVEAAGAAPAHHPDCCLSISKTLLHVLAQRVHSLVGHRTVLSIGCGSGLLEACLTKHDPLLRVDGVEVNASLNKYLRPDRYHTVLGTWDLYPRAEHADVWLFVYPRAPELVQKYLETFGSSDVTQSSKKERAENLRPPSPISSRILIWLGPRSDWGDYQSVLQAWSSFELDVTASHDAGLVPYEMMVIARKSYNDTVSVTDHDLVTRI